MKKFTLFLLALFYGIAGMAQLSGTKFIPGDYATLTEAVTALNGAGVGPGGVTFNIAGGYSESIIAPIQITATGTPTDPVVFQQDPAISGTHPLVTRSDAGTLGTSILGGQGDAIIIVDGGDYISFEKIDVTTSQSGIEYGYYLRRESPANGCKYVTISNCVITMVKGTSAYVAGIYSSNNDAASLVSSASGITLTSTGGRTESLTIKGCTVQNVFAGILLRGFSAASPFDLYDQNALVGVSGNGNTIQNYAGNTASTSYGVYLIYQTNPTVSYNSIYNAGGGGTNATNTLYGILMSTTSAGGNFVANSNTITLGISATSGAHCIYNSQPCTSITINNNRFSYGTFASTSASYLIYCSNGTNSITVDGNATVGAITKTGAGSLYGYYNNGSPTGGTATVTNNNFSNFSLTGASSFYGIQQTSSVTQIQTINGNTISNITGGSNPMYGIYQGYGSSGNTVNNNNVYGITSTSGTIYGLYLGASLGPTTLSCSGNNVYNLSASGAGAIYGVYNALGTASQIYKNKVFNLSSGAAGSLVYGIHIAGGTTTSVYNNFISEIKAPASNAANPVVGINVAGGTTDNIFYNTVYLSGTSSGGLFGSSCVYASTTPAVDMRDNILVNASSPVGSTGYACAYRRSGTTLTNYSNNSNNNCLYAGTPGANNLLFYDGTNTYQTLAAYQSAMTPRETASFTELPPFINVSTAPYDLHIGPAPLSQCESGGHAISSPIVITEDIDGNTRNPLPDVGADEFETIWPNSYPQAFAVSQRNSHINNVTFIPNVAGNNVVIVYNTTGTFTTPSGPPPTPGNPLAGGTLLANTTVSPVSHSGLSFGTTYYYKAYSYDGSIYSAPLSAACTPSVLPPAAFSSTTLSSSEIQLNWTRNTFSDPVIVATNSSGTFGTPVNGTPYTAGTDITGGGTVIYTGSLSSFIHSGLGPNTTCYYKIWTMDDANYYPASGLTSNSKTFCNPAYPGYWLENFESSTFPPDCWSSAIVSGSYNWIRSATGGYSFSASAESRFYYNAAGSKYDLLTPRFDTSAGTPLMLRFKYAYAAYTGKTDTMEVFTSSNSGQTWTLTQIMPGGATGILNTAGTLTSEFTPTLSSQWKEALILLPFGTNMAKFRAISDYGNNLYLDIVTVEPVGDAYDYAVGSIDINPAVNLQFTPKATITNTGFAVRNCTATIAIGGYRSTKTVYHLAVGASFQVTFDSCTLPAGDYTVSVEIVGPDMNQSNDHLSSTIKVLDLNKQTYAYITDPGTGSDPAGPVSFTLANPGALTSISNQASLDPVAGSTWAYGTWYACLKSATPPHALVTIDPSTGARTAIGDLGMDVPAISYNPQNSTLYGLFYNDAGTELYTIDMVTAIPTLVGQASASEQLMSLAIDNSGNAYAIGVGSDNFGSVNLTTGAWTSIGPIGFDAASGGLTMDFDRATGNLFLVGGTTTSNFLSLVNTMTGVALKIGDFEGNARVTGIVFTDMVNKTFRMKAFLEGLYTGGGTMNQAHDESGPKYTSGIADKVTVELHDATTYSTTVHSFPNIDLHTNGTATLTVPGALSGSYYVTIRHRNGITTVSAVPVAFPTGTITYNFSDNITKAYGNNLLYSEGGVYLLYSGDVNLDGIIDGGDMSTIDNLAAVFTAGYLPADCNGDGLIDGSDLSIADNNASAFIGAATP